MFLKHSFFALIIIAVFFLALELALALAGIRPAASTEDPLVGFSGNIPLFVETVLDDGTVVMRTAENKLVWFNDQSFPKIKNKDSYRIFCVGGSTTVGHPYKDSTSFCGWLREFLKAVEPGRDWEVINAGGVSYASYRVARLMQELVRYQPDLFIVYSGQNEFLEERSYGDLRRLPPWLVHTNAVLSYTRTYAAVKGLVDAAMPGAAPQQAAQSRTLLDSEVDEILTHTRGPTSYHRDEQLKQQVIEHYRINLVRMIQIARQANAGIVLVNPASNLKDMSPFKSEHKSGLTDAQLAEWEDLYARGNKDYYARRYAEALDSYRKALDIDDRYAELHFRIGKAQFFLADFEAAEQSFWRAIDEDVAPLRILSAMRNVVADVAAWHRVRLIDFQKILKDAYREEYDHTVFGKEYFLDHVHTKIAGYRLLGQALLEELVEQGIVPGVTSLTRETIIRVSQEINSRLDTNSQRDALIRLGKTLDWAGKFDEAYTVFELSIELFGPHAFVYSMMGKTSYRAGNNRQAIIDLRKSASIDPDIEWVHRLLGRLLSENGRTEEAVRHFTEALRIDDSDATTHQELAMVLASRGDSARASHHFSEALRVDPDNDAAQLNYTVFLMKTGRDDEAMTRAQAMLEQGIQRAEAHNIIGILSARNDQFAQAIKHFTRALEIRPDLQSAEENLAKVKAAAANGSETENRQP